MKELFEKVYIKSEKDLPKECGYYPVHQKGFEQNYIMTMFYNGLPDNLWTQTYDYYLRPLESQELPAEEMKQKLCDKIEEILRGVKLKNFTTDEGDSLALVDILSIPSESTIKSGQDEIENITEQIYFELPDNLMNEFATQPHSDIVKPSDQDIENASRDYINDDRFNGLLTTMKQTIRRAYYTGAENMRDNNIYISPKNKIMRTIDKYLQSLNKE